MYNSVSGILFNKQMLQIKNPYMTEHSVTRLASNDTHYAVLCQEFHVEFLSILISIEFHFPYGKKHTQNSTL